MLINKNTKLKDKVEMLEFFYEANGFNKRGLHNSIQIAEYISKLEAQIEKMKMCSNCDYYFGDRRCYYETECKNKDHWKLKE